jgi:hypothetical protein
MKTSTYIINLKSFIIFNEIIIYILKLCFFIHEVEIPWIWSNFIMLIK